MFLSHANIWAAIDALAERHSLTASGLAKRAGLDPTTFNKSKRYAGDGRARWPSTESLAKVMEATGERWSELQRSQPLTLDVQFLYVNLPREELRKLLPIDPVPPHRTSSPAVNPS